MKRYAAFSGAAAVLASGLALAHQPEHGTRSASNRLNVPVEEKAFGRAGDPKKVSRTIRVDMSDAMRFAPSSIEVRQHETVRFVARNSGKQMHEMVLGTMAELKEHHALMKKHPEMVHDEPHMAHVAPGKTDPIVWQFTRAGEFYYGCLIPGHFEAGMIGKIVVKSR